MSPRVVADSNVIISAFHRGGTPLAVLDLARRGTIELCLSPFLVDEVRGVLRVKFGWEPLRIRLALRGLRATLVRPRGRQVHVVADPADNRILECALTARADYLTTGDRELLAIGSHRSTAILTPRALLTRLS